MFSNNSHEILRRLQELNNFLSTQIKKTQDELNKMQDQRYRSRYLKYQASFKTELVTRQMVVQWQEHKN